MFRLIIQSNGSYLIHCRWSQGRSGMVIMLLECLMGADYNYIYYDFTMTFKNFNMIGKHNRRILVSLDNYEVTLICSIVDLPV